MTLKEWLENTSKEIKIMRDKSGRFIIKRKNLICNDGLSLSVQASEFHYCAPKKITDTYDCVEVYAHGEEVKELNYLGYHMVDTCYRYVYVSDLEKVVTAHGGIKDDGN